MANLNKVLLIGNLTRDPEMRYTPAGKAVTSFSLAINRQTGGAGERREEVCFVRVVCWEKLAELCNQYLHKGRPVFVEGRLQSRSWQAPDGSKRSTMEVVAQTVQFLGPGKGRAEGGAESAGEASFPAYEADPVSARLADLAAEPHPDEPPPF